ncbi:MAG TPA: heavy metal-binding domain-containing protein [Candidatus Binatia bacterium]|nr:heavy metal-binding domain-containing protein [Candidatus Binatia bacterium]
MSVIPHPRADAALACLAGHGGERHQGRAFSSDLSVDEAVLLKEIGYQPCGLVVGSAVYHIGVQNLYWNDNQEMTELTQAMYQARHEALSSLERHAQQVGGQGVVGLQLDVRVHHGMHSLAEFVAMGTAVANPEKRASGTWVSDLSGQDLYLLIRAGYVPVGLAFGACVYYVARQGLSQWLGQQSQNVEMTNYTTALYQARELAMTRMQDEARRGRAQGIVAMRIEQKSHVWGSHVIEFLAVGTAVRLTAAEHLLMAPELAVSLEDQAVAVTDAVSAPASEGGEA